jgi:predicted TIM-barrel fold metal-dependent hydrolase
VRAAIFLLCAATAAAAQTPVDSALLAYINAIRAIDSHAHPMRPVAAGAPADTDFDALPLDGIPPFPVPARMAGLDPIWRAAQSALYHVPAAANDSLYKEALKAAYAAARYERGESFPIWALDQAGIDLMMANRTSMGRGLPAARFKWVSFVDALMLPLDTRAEAARTPDTRSLYPREATLLRRYMRDLGIAKLPATLDAFVKTVVTPTLARQRAAGAVGVKFEAAYLRPLDFDTPNEAEARRVYARYAGGGVPTHAEYKALEDYLFRVIAREAGRSGMAVQIHTLEDFGGFYSARGSAPFQLEPVFNDSTLRGTNFIIVHGGWPLVSETEAMLGKPNAYADISMMVILLPPALLAPVLRQWLTQWPDKVLFGTDAFDGGPEQGWEQVAWVGSTTARRGLAMALTAMVRDGEVTPERARELARMVMRENAITVYKLTP